MTNEGPLRDQLKNLLNREQLRENEFADIEALLGKSTDSPTRSWRRPRLAAAMVASLVLIVGTWLYTLDPADNNQIATSQRIAEEVLANHIHIHTLDLETSSMEQIRQGMDRLNFVPVSTRATTGDNLTLLGARYCTLQGVIATQLMFVDERGGLVTFYQAAYDPERFGALPDINQQQNPLTVVKNGMDVRIWVEQDVVIAQAR